MSDNRILLVEDEPDLADLLMLILRSNGYVADLALTVTQAERLLTERSYGLVIADWRLPDGDGSAFADRAADLGMKTAILTGYALQLPTEKAARHEVWMKPMRPSELITAVEGCIGKAGVVRLDQ